MHHFAKLRECMTITSVALGVEESLSFEQQLLLLLAERLVGATAASHGTNSARRR